MVLVYIEIHQGEIKKSGLEAICFAAQIAKLKSSPLTALVLSNSDSLAGLGNYGVQNVLVANQNIDGSDSQNLCSLISQVAEKIKQTILFYQIQVLENRSQEGLQ